MKKINTLIALLALIVASAIFAGCQPAEPPATNPPGETKVGDPEDSKSNTAETADPPAGN